MLIACGAPPALPLQPDDFTLAGVPPDTDSAEIRLSFGDPDSILTADNPYETGTQLVTWLYDGFEVRFAGDSMATGYMIHAPGESTARGVTVGDDARTVLRTYGAPTTRLEPSWTYVDATDESALRVIDLLIREDTVRRIYIGRAYY